MLYQSLASSGNPENMDDYQKGGEEEFKKSMYKPREIGQDIRDQFQKLTNQDNDNDLHNILEELSPEVKRQVQQLQQPQ